jgi:hypothetical protein
VNHRSLRNMLRNYAEDATIIVDLHQNTDVSAASELAFVFQWSVLNRL